MNNDQPEVAGCVTDDHDYENSQEEMHMHTPTETGRRFLLALTLTTTILAAEVIGGLWTGSLALLSDAGHVFMDVFALGLSYAALRVATLPPNDRHSYGFHRFKVLAALINGATLFWIAIEIFREAWSRLQTGASPKMRRQSRTEKVEKVKDVKRCQRPDL